MNRRDPKALSGQGSWMKRPTLVLPTAAFLLASGPVLSKAVSRHPGLACRGLGSADLHLVLTRPGVDVPGEELWYKQRKT